MEPITVFYRDFISSTEYDEDNINAVHFIADVRFFPTENGKEFIDVWNGIFNLRVDNTTIRLHSVEKDISLIYLEAKLNLLKETIEKFITLYCKRTGGSFTKPINKKVWLNDGKLKSHYTGYCSYNLDEYGNGRLSIADCHRAIIIPLMSYDHEGTHHPSGNETIVDDISKAITEAIDKIKELRTLYEAGKTVKA